MDRFAAGTVFSSIDATGRYRYVRQPQMMHWNMARFAESLLPPIKAFDHEGAEAANTIVAGSPHSSRPARLPRHRRTVANAGPSDREAAISDRLSKAADRTG